MTVDELINWLQAHKLLGRIKGDDDVSVNGKELDEYGITIEYGKVDLGDSP